MVKPTAIISAVFSSGKPSYSSPSLDSANLSPTLPTINIAPAM